MNVVQSVACITTVPNISLKRLVCTECATRRILRDRAPFRGVKWAAVWGASLLGAINSSCFLLIIPDIAEEMTPPQDLPISVQSYSRCLSNVPSTPLHGATLRLCVFLELAPGHNQNPCDLTTEVSSGCQVQVAGILHPCNAWHSAVCRQQLVCCLKFKQLSFCCCFGFRKTCNKSLVLNTRASYTIFVTFFSSLDNAESILGRCQTTGLSTAATDCGPALLV